jgi:hypothetical protein
MFTPPCVFTGYPTSTGAKACAKYSTTLDVPDAIRLEPQYAVRGAFCMRGAIMSEWRSRPQYFGQVARQLNCQQALP